MQEIFFLLKSEYLLKYNWIIGFTHQTFMKIKESLKNIFCLKLIIQNFVIKNSNKKSFKVIWLSKAIEIKKKLRWIKFKSELYSF